MPVTPPYPPLRARSGSSTSDLIPVDTAKNERNTTIAVSVAISFLVLIFIFRWVQKIGMPWYRRHQAAKPARKKALADRQAWYRSTRPIIRVPTFPRSKETHPSSLLAEHLNSVQYPDAAHIDHSSNLQEGCDIVMSPSVAHFSKSSQPRGPSTGPSTFFQSMSTLRLVSDPTEQIEPDLEPFPAFDPGRRPSTESHYGYDIGLQPLRESYHTDETIASVGVAVPLKIPASLSPMEVQNSRPAPR